VCSLPCHCRWACIGKESGKNISSTQLDDADISVCTDPPVIDGLLAVQVSVSPRSARLSPARSTLVRAVAAPGLVGPDWALGRPVSLAAAAAEHTCKATDCRAHEVAVGEMGVCSHLFPGPVAYNCIYILASPANVTSYMRNNCCELQAVLLPTCSSHPSLPWN
jgi:hypothetical protein